MYKSYIFVSEKVFVGHAKLMVTDWSWRGTTERDDKINVLRPKQVSLNGECERFLGESFIINHDKKY